MRKPLWILSALVVGAVAGAAGTSWYLLREAPSAESAVSRRYYCPMHPSMISDHPGSCPICQMKMVLMPEHPEQDSAASAGSPVAGRAPVRLDASRRQLIGVRTARVERRHLIKEIRTVGRVTYDESRLHHVHTKIGGWIDKLYADTTGQLVTKGQPLLAIYSPELFSSQQEFQLALQARDRLAGSTLPSVAASGEQLVASARRRLQLYDLTPGQIAALESGGEVTRATTIYAPMTGYVIAKNVTHGERIEPGTTLLDLADLSRLWVLADIYEYEVPFVRQGQKATMTLSYLPGRTFEGRVAFVYPVLSEQSRTVKARLEFANPDLTLKPEMYAEVRLESDLGEKLVVPAGAVISTGERDIVFRDLGDGLLEPREVKVGARLENSVEVVEGLSEGDLVVASGNFLVDSESKLKAALGAAGAHVH